MKKKQRPHRQGSKSRGRGSTTDEKSRGEDAPDGVRNLFPVVGIGASAGGLDAYKSFFSAMPADNGMAFVLIPHLDPSHESFMVELLAKQTEMAVCQAEDGMLLRPNAVYIIPPNKFLSISEGALRLEYLPVPLGQQTAIDPFFRALAATYGEMAIGIIMSGTGAHGSLGLREISAQGGLAMVQNPATAGFSQMPQSAIATGVVDYILPVEEMPATLIEYRDQLLGGARRRLTPSTEVSKQLEQILTLLLTRTRYDFHCYRKKMLMRRIHRRMDLGHLEHLSDYYKRLKNDTDEVALLFKDLLINVTSFFRDPDAFKVLQEEFIGPLVENKAIDTPVRVWVPACATGEEAYSIAILLMETFSRLQLPYNIQIFATDLDEEVLEYARHGVYPESIANDISPARLGRFFTKMGEHHYQVNKQLREVVVFAVQNLVGDAPFSKLDLISCRNLLIYLEPDIQRKLIALFHFSLKPGAYLLLGPSETIGHHIDLFDVASKKWRIFRRISPTRHDIVEFPIVPTAVQRRRLPASYLPQEAVVSTDFAELTRNLLIETCVPAAVLINRKHEILYFQGSTSRYLELPTGKPTSNLIEMAREGLRNKLLAACHKAIRINGAVTVEKVWVNSEDGNLPVSLSVMPVNKPKVAEGLLLVTFSDIHANDEAGEVVDTNESTGGEATPVVQLEYDLKATRDDLRSTIEELESSNEELKASNEEVTSMNEELQSVNEELETSKEELQSLNEELTTVNNQLQDKVEELEQANNDITNLLENTEIATLFLDTELHLKRFTPAVERLLPLKESDIGRPFSVFSMQLYDASLLDDVRHVLETLVPAETEASAPDGRTYLRRVKPYRTSDNRIDGVVLTFVDITERVKAFAESRRLATVLLDSNDALCVVDLDGRITAWNRGAVRMYGYSDSEALKMHAQDLIPEAGRQVFKETMARIIDDEEIESYEAERITKNGRLLDIWATATKLVDENEKVVSIAVTERDITHRKRIETDLQRLNDELERRIEDRTVELRRSEQEFRMLADNVPALFSYVDADQRYRYVNPRCMAVHARDQSDIIGRTLLEVQGTQFYETLRPYVEEVLTGHEMQFEMEIPDHEGNLIFQTTVMPDLDEQGQVRGFFVLASDITDRKRAERALDQERQRLRAIVETAADAIVAVDREGIIRDFNQAAERIFGYTSGQAIGRNFQCIMPPLNGEADTFPHQFHLTQELRKGDVSREELLGRRKDGSFFPLEMTLTEIDHLELYVALLRDITARKELEHEVIEMSTIEQERIGREIHDGIGQQLTALGMLASSLQKKLTRSQKMQEAEKAGQMVAFIQHSLDEVKALSRGLAPIEIGPDGLADSLGILVERAKVSSHIQCTLTISGLIPLLDEIVAVHLYRIVQEAIHNAIKHAEASHIEVTIKSVNKRLVVTIRDNGSGIDSITDRKETLGLHIINYRAGIIGASLSIESVEKGGTQIKCSLPIKDPNTGNVDV